MTFYDDTWTQTKGMPDTFEFTVALDKSYHTEHLVELNQVIFQYENEYHLFTITEVEETHGDTGYIRCFCESTTMELLNSVVLPSNHASVSVEKALEIILSDTSWEVGRTEYFPAQNLEMSSFGTVLSEVQNLPNLFGGTPVFRIEYEGGKVTGKYVDYVDRIGSDTGMRFVYGENVENVTRKVDTTNIVTAVIPVGNNDLTIKEIECTEGVHGFNKPIGKYYIEVSEKERSEISTSPYHIFGTLQVETDDPNELAIQGWKHLQDNLVPNIEYEFSPLLLDSKNIPNLGDTVRAIDRDMNNLQLTAEVTEIQISFSDETRNLITLANYEKVESNIEDQIILIQQTLLNSNLDNPLINVSDTDPSIDKELVNGTLWVDTSDSGNGNVVLKEYDNGKWNETLTENTVDTKLDTQKTEITNETDTKLDNQKVEITQETDTKLETLETTILDKIQPIELEIEKIPEIEVQVEKIPAIEAETLKIPQLVTDIDAVEQQTTNLAQKDTQLQSAIDKQAEEVAKVDQAVTQAKADIESANTKIADAKAELETTKTNLSNAKTELLNKINNISVGARNLLVDSNKEVTGFNEFVQFADLAPIFDEHGLVEYTISFDLKSKDVTNENTISVYCQNGNNTKYFISTTYFKVTTEYQRFSLRAIPRLSGQNTDMAMLAFYGMYDTGNIPVVRNVKVEKGNIPTDYTIAPEDIETSITNVETEIDNINGELSTKVSKTEFNALSNKVSANETQINQTSESIKLLATKTELNTVANDLGTLEETVSSNTAQLEVQAGRIATKVTQEQVETIVNTAIESMSGDGQNLVIYGACDDFPRLIDTDTQTTSMNASITTSKELKLKATGSEADNFYIFGTINTLSGLLLDTYTMTMDIKIPSDSTVTVNNLNFVVWESDNSQSTNLSTLTPISTSGEWNRYSVTKTFTNEAATARQFFVRLANVTDYSNAYVLVDNVKIERGSEPTAFTKNPNEMTATELAALKQRVSNAEAKIELNADSIEAKVSKDVYESDLATQNAKISSAESKITANADAIATKVSKTELQTGIDNIQIGGRNLLRNTAFSGLSYWGYDITGFTINVASGVVNITKAESSYRQNFYQGTSNSNLVMKESQDYTISIDLKANGTVPSGSSVFYRTVFTDGTSREVTLTIPTNLTSEWVRYTATGKVHFEDKTPSIYSFAVALGEGAGGISVRHPQLEEGNKATKWRPAPEDIQNDINALGGRLTTAESTITQQADQIALKVEKTDIIEAINYKSDNKILNGYGEMKDNTNFSTFTYDEGNMYNGTPSFSKPQTNFESLANNYIPVDINRKYRLSGNFKSVGVTDSNKTYIGFSSYDVDFNNISPENVMYIKGSTTTLAQDLKNGDTVVYLTDVSGFNKALTPTYQRGFIFWNYKNKSGYQYPVETYSRNVFLDRWADASSFNATNNTITLKTAWTGGTFPSGTSVSQTSAGNTWNYMFGGNTSTIGEEWNHQRLDIISLRDDGLVSNDSFRHGTAYIKFRVRNASTSGTFYMNSISLVDITEMVESEYYTNSKINSTKAEFKVTTDEISSKVTKLETTTANQATTIAKHETSITNNANAIELKASKTELETAVDNISIGGRNLALNTSTDVHLTAGTNKFSYQRYKLPVSLKKGDILTISVDYTKVAGTATDFYVTIYDYETTTKRLAVTTLPITGGRTSKTFTITNTNIEGVEYNSLLIYAGRGGETQGNEVIISHVKLEYGNKATDWTPAPEDIDSEISALGTRVTSAESSITQNANQIATKVSKDGVISSINQSAESVTINASKVNLNGQLTIGHFSDALANQVNTASTNASTALTNAATAQSTANTATNKANTAQSTANTATKLAQAMATGKLLYKDPTFKSGTNNVLLYNNAGNGMVTVERIAKPADCPTSSTHCMRITSKGETNPALGGIKQLYDHKPSKKFVIRYIIKLPVGYSLHTAGNAGASSDVLVGSAKGTGNYREYIRVVQCETDTTSTYGNGGYLFVNYDTAEGGTVPTESNPLVWYLAKIECYDVTDGDYAVQDAQATADSAVTVLGNWAYDANKTYINGGNIYTGTIVADKIASNAVTSDKIAANAITSDKIAANTIEAGDIKAGTITSTQIAANTITAGNIAANAVTASEIAANAVTADKINANAVTADKIAANSITAGKISSLNGLNVNDQLIVDSSGNVSFSGDLTGASGTFSGSITQDDDTNGKVTIERSEVKLINNEGTQYTNLLYGGLDIEKTINNVKYDTILQHDTLAFLTGGTVKSQITNNNGALKFEGTSLDFDNLTINNFKTPLNVTVTGAGNVVNGATYDASTQTLNLTKSASFVTASNGVFYNQPKINGNESGYVGIGGYTSETSGNVSGYYCQFKLQHSATPAAVTLTAVSSAGSNKFTNTISQHGFWFYITNTSGAKGYVYWRGTYQTS